MCTFNKKMYVPIAFEITNIEIKFNILKHDTILNNYVQSAMTETDVKCSFIN